MKHKSMAGLLFDLFMRGLFLFLGLILMISFGYTNHVWP